MSVWKSRVAWVACVALILCGCSAGPESSVDRNELNDKAGTTLKSMNLRDPELAGFLKSAYGYAIFPDVGKAAFIAGAAYGWAAVYEKGELVGYADISQATIGAQAGAQGYSELIAFQSVEAMNRFKASQLAFDANVSAVALKAGAADTAKYENGVAVFVAPTGGLMVEAAVGGQTFSFEPK